MKSSSPGSSAIGTSSSSSISAATKELTGASSYGGSGLGLGTGPLPISAGDEAITDDLINQAGVALLDKENDSSLID